MENNQNTNEEPTREHVTFTTTSKEKALKWCADREAEGYTVRMEYNEETGIFTCTAIR
jgi:hypothetical protein